MPEGMVEKTRRKEIEKMLERAIRDRLFPAVALSIFDASGATEFFLAGGHHYGKWAEQVDRKSLFDLASLTKPLVTTLCAMALVETGRLDLDSPLISLFGPCNKDIAVQFSTVTPYMLLTHTSCLEAHRLLTEEGLSAPFDPCHQPETTVPFSPLTPREVMERLASFQAASTTGSSPPCEAVYSDLGFILLGLVLEEVAQMPIHQLFFKVLALAPGATGPEDGFRFFLRSETGLYDPGQEKEMVIPTGWCPFRRRMLLSEVHDLNAWLMGGLGGHAGLFGSIEAVTWLLILLLRTWTGELEGTKEADLIAWPSRKALQLFWSADHPSGNPWSLGFDRPSATESSAGTILSRNAVGHLGYTGTSFWIDLERRKGVVLLTNRTFPLDSPDSRRRMKEFRPRLHDAVLQAIIQEEHCSSGMIEPCTTSESS